jgi:hypothetical protein
MTRLFAVLALVMLLPIAAMAQSTPPQSKPLEAYLYGQGAPTPPYPSSLCIPAVPGPVANSIECIPANILNAPAIPTLASTGYPSTYTNRATTGGAYTIANGVSGILLTGPDQGTDGLNSACKSPPATPYSIIGHFATTATIDGGGGFAWKLAAGTRVETIYAPLLYPSSSPNNGPAVFAIDFADQNGTSPTSEGNIASPNADAWVKLVDNGTSLQVFWSATGNVWIPVYAAIPYASTYLGAKPDQVCLFASGHGSAVGVELQFYKETSP